MLLVQWGTEYGAKPDEFYFDLTRQFIEEAASEEEEVDEDSRIFQLSLTFHYKGAAKLEDSNKWCHSPAKAEEFRAFVLSCPGLVATRNAQMKKAVLRLECAG